MNTYSEKRGYTKFNWWDALNDPSKYYHNYLASISGSWVTCACGNQCDILPRSEAGEPEDIELRNLGLRFNLLVMRYEWDKAKETLAKIEKRSSFLIKQINKNGPNN